MRRLTLPRHLPSGVYLRCTSPAPPPLHLPARSAAHPPVSPQVHAELGEVVNGSKTGREGDEIIVCDLTGTGAQDAAIGQVAWDKLSTL